jgi:hypothetical protein
VFLFGLLLLLIWCGVTLRRVRMLMRWGFEKMGGEGHRLDSEAMML